MIEEWGEGGGRRAKVKTKGWKSLRGDE